MDDANKKDVLKRMAGVVGHELRNPLAIMSNSLYFIKARLSAVGAELDPKIAKHLGILEGEVKQSNEVIEQMLAYTRPKELQRSPAAANAALKDLEAAWKPVSGITLKIETDPADPRVNADMEVLVAALRAAVQNASQAMPEGGSITAACGHEGSQVFFTVSDTGPGLPDGDGEKVFEPFFTTKPRGLGLGLTQARRWLELHGGSARAENLPGGGAKVTLTLPAA
jgi:signal transduction histidine kinase